MLDIVGSVKGLLKIDKVCTDNNVFRLHYKATMAVLIVFSLIVTSKQYIGDPIDCIVDEIPQNIMDTYCWIYSTFTIPNKLTARIGKDVAHPGVGTHVPDEDEIKYHKYYQWVCFVLILQALLFYIPRYLWKTWENNRIKSLIMDLNQPVVSPQCKEDRKGALKEYFRRNAGSHDSYFYRFFLCEVLNFVNVLGQFFFMDYFLDGEFLSYGHYVFQYNNNFIQGDEDPMAKVFPKVTKCTFHKYGPSGTVQRFDGLCVLPVNILNEKMYAILWFWFVILIIISGLMVVYRLFYVLTPCTRLMALCSGDGGSYKPAVRRIANSLRIGDWFLLQQLKKNIDEKIFGEIMYELSYVLDEKFSR